MEFRFELFHLSGECSVTGSGHVKYEMNGYYHSEKVVCVCVCNQGAYADTFVDYQLLFTWPLSVTLKVWDNNENLH